MARRFTGVPAAFMLLALSAPAQAMSVADMLARIDKLEGKGMLALFHKGEINALMGEVRKAGDTYRAELAKAQAAGDQSLGCPPPRGSVKMSSKDMIAQLRSVPPAQRATTSFQSFFNDFMKTRFPCK